MSSYTGHPSFIIVNNSPPSLLAGQLSGLFLLLRLLRRVFLDSSGGGDFPEDESDFAFSERARMPITSSA